MLDVPALVRNRALAAGAGEWLASLPELIARLESQWSIVVGTPFGDATEAYVAEARTSEGTPAVLKLMVPHDDRAVRHEVTTLELCAGHGCVQLLRSDETQRALLLERLGPSLSDLGVPLRRRHEILCATAQQVWRVVAPDVDLPTGREKASWLARWIESGWEELDHPCSEKAVALALLCAERRAAAHRAERAVLVHGDVHQWNALSAGDGFKLVDPDGLLAEPECDLGVLMREDPADLLQGDAHERATWLAGLTGLDAVAIWEWGVVERVSTGLLGTKLSMQPEAGLMLRAADAVAENA